MAWAEAYRKLKIVASPWKSELTSVRKLDVYIPDVCTSARNHENENPHIYLPPPPQKRPPGCRFNDYISIRVMWLMTAHAASRTTPFSLLLPWSAGEGGGGNHNSFSEMDVKELYGSLWNFAELKGHPMHSLWEMFDRVTSGHGAMTS